MGRWIFFESVGLCKSPDWDLSAAAYNSFSALQIIINNTAWNKFFPLKKHGEYNRSRSTFSLGILICSKF